MNERSLIALLTLPLVVAVTSLLGPGQSPPNAPTAIETKNEAPPAKEADFASRPLKNACQVLSDYFALPVEPSSGEATGKVSFSIKETDFSLSASATEKAVERCNVEAVRDALRKENMGIDASFVFIPDPNASALALEADRALDAVRSALSSMGYVPYKASVLPWKSARTREKEAKTSDAKESGSSQPGIWLFRNQAAPRDLKLIFLVGDSPTAGISKPQFQQAVQQFRPLFRGVTKLRLVGPIYSGSVDSLGHAIRQLPPPGPGVPWAVFATSGTAEVPKLKDRLAKVVGSTAHIEFEQFAKLNALEDLLKSLRTMGRTAVLTESDTVFGLNHTEGADELFKYSRDLLSLRSAYAADKDLMSRIFPRSARWTEQLALHLSSPQDPTDAIPTYDPDNLAVSLQNTLRHLASNLHRRHFRNLIIIGSDNLDAIFLTRFFQEENPNLRIALLDSDTLLDRHAERVSTRGVITISQQPTGSVAMKHTEFPNGQAFGIYRACRRVLFNQEEKLKPNRIISVVGYDGEWPIQVLSPLPEGPKPAEVANLFDIFHFHWIGPLMAFGLLLAWLALSPILVHSWSLRFRGNFGTTS